MHKTLIVLGIVLLILGLGWPWLGKLPFGRLPGDIYLEKGTYRIFFPLTTSIVISIIVSLLVWFLRK